uniref:Rho guanine nucleotide exchange factor 12 n=1 Tax=Trichuris muris TaxID=70415 RepID=A0A5S6QK26_TRIMR
MLRQLSKAQVPAASALAPCHFVTSLMLVSSVDSHHALFALRSGSAAAKAGIRRGDRIVKVNGVLVAGLNHLDVAKLMSGSSYVSLTLFGRSEGTMSSMAVKGVMTNGKRLQRRSTDSCHFDLSFKAKPSTSGTTKRLEWRLKRRELVQQMLVEEKKQLEVLRQEATGTDTNGDRLQLIEKAERRIGNLEIQLKESAVATPATVEASQPVMPKEAGDSTAECSEPEGAAELAGRRNGSPSGLEPTADSTLSLHGSPAPSMHHMVERFLDVEDDLVAENSPTDDAIFATFLTLKDRLAHLAIFLHYLLSNNDPSFVLFYLVTDVFNLSGLTKHWRQWAYEIYSSFLAHIAPCKLQLVDRDACEDLDVIFSKPTEQLSPDGMRRLFDRARESALVTANEQLADFRNKRILGLGSVFGESLLHGLKENDPASEAKVFDALISPHVPTYFDRSWEYGDLTRRAKVILSSLSTLFKHCNVKCSSAEVEKLLEKCPTYVSKEKSNFACQLLAKSNRRVKNHCFVLIPVCQPMFCEHCHELLWGIKATGLLCTKCNIVVHKRCMSSLQNECTSVRTTDIAFNSKSASAKEGNKLSTEERPAGEDSSMKLQRGEDEGFVGAKRAGTAEPVDGMCAEKEDLKATALSDEALEHGLQPGASPTDENAFFVRSKSMTMKKDFLKGPEPTNDTFRRSNSDYNEQKKAGVKRVESVSEYLGNDSPYLSDDSEAPAVPALAYTANLRHYENFEYDSDFEIDTEIAPLEELLPQNLLVSLETRERKRLEVVYELLHTERTHVRNLKVLYRLFYLRFVEYKILPSNVLNLMFPNLELVLEVHTEINETMRAFVAKDQFVSNISDMCLSLFCGEAGERLKNIASTFCQHMQQALEALKQEIKKDQKLRDFLQVIESLPVCRKLQLRDMLPMEMQRLTKYPLLLESILKYTPDTSAEAEQLKKSIEGTHAILEAVNTAKRNSENKTRLEQLRRNIDTSQFAKVNHPMSDEYRRLNVTNYSLVYEGSLFWRLGKNKVVALHAVLLDELLLLLSKSSDGHRLTLRFHNLNTGKEDMKWTHCPLLKLSNLIAKDMATDKKAFFLVSTSPYGPQIYELAASSFAEKKSWISYLTEQIEICRKRDQGKRCSVSMVEDVGSESKRHKEHSPGRATGHVRSHFQERVRVTCQPRLISPSEINVCQPTVFQHARPILNPLDQLRQEDQSVIKALNEKIRIISNFFGTSGEEGSSAPVAEGKGCREARELLITAVKHTNRLLEAINEHTRLVELETGNKGNGQIRYSLAHREIPSVPCSQLTQIAAAQMECLTSLLNSLQIMAADLQRVQRELHHYKLSPERLLACHLISEKAVDTHEGGVCHLSTSERLASAADSDHALHAAVVGKPAAPAAVSSEEPTSENHPTTSSVDVNWANGQLGMSSDS